MSKIIHGLDEYIKLNYTGKWGNKKEIAKYFSISPATVKDHLKKLGLYSDKAARIYDVNDDALKVWSNDMAYVIGFILADGFVYHKRSTIQVRLHTKDIEILEFIRSFFGSNAPIKTNDFTTKNGNLSTTSVLNITSPTLCSDLLSLGVLQRKEDRLKIPSNMPTKYVHPFIRGFFDGDGCVYLDKRRNTFDTQITSICMPFLESIRTYMANIGSILISKKATHNRKVAYVWRMTHKPSLQFRDWIYQDGGFALSRKRAKFYRLDCVS